MQSPHKKWKPVCVCIFPFHKRFFIVKKKAYLDIYTKKVEPLFF